MPEIDLDLVGIDQAIQKLEQLDALAQRITGRSPLSSSIQTQGIDYGTLKETARIEAQEGAGATTYARAQVGQLYESVIQQVHGTAFAPVTRRQTMEQIRDTLAEAGYQSPELAEYRGQQAAAEQKEQERQERDTQREADKQARQEARAAQQEEREQRRDQNQEMATLRSNQFARRRLASLISRGVNPREDPYLMARMQRAAGSDDPEAIEETLQGMTAQAIALREVSPLGANPLIAGLAAAQVGRAAMGLATNAIVAQGAGEPFRPSENLGGFLGIAGAIAGGALGALTATPFGIVAGAAGGSLIAGQMGNVASEWFRGRRERTETSETFAGSLGISPADADRILTEYGDRRGPNGVQYGRDWAAQLLGPLSMSAYLGTGQRDIGGIANVLMDRFGKGATTAAQDLAPFQQNPIFGPLISTALQGMGPNGAAYNTLSQFLPTSEQRPGGNLTAADAASMMLFAGPEATIAALKKFGRTDLEDKVQEFNKQLTTSQLDIGIAGSESQAAGSRFGATALTAAPDSAAFASGAKAYLGKLDENVKALDDQLAILHKQADGGNKYAQAAIAAAEAADEAARTQREQVRVQTTVARQAFEVSRIQATEQLTNIAFQREQLGLPAGQTNPQFAEQVREARAEQAKQEEIARTSPDAGARQAAMVAAEQARYQAEVVIPHERTMQAVTTAAAHGEVGFGMEEARFRQALAFGATTPDAQAGFTSLIGAAGRTLDEEKARAAKVNAEFIAHRATQEEKDAADQAANEAQLRLQTLQREQRYFGPGRQALYAGYAAEGVEAGASLQQRLRLGPSYDIEAAREVYAAHSTEIQATQAQLTAAQRSNDEPEAKRLQALLQTQRAGAVEDFATRTGTFNLSSQDQLRLNSTSTAISLLESNPLTGGMVPMGVRQMAIRQINNALGQFQTQADAIPEGPLRDQFRAANWGQVAGLLAERQREQVALQEGEMGHMLDVSSGATGNFTLFGTSTGLPSARLYQQHVPGGLRGLGSSGRDVGANTDLMRDLGSLAGGIEGMGASFVPTPGPGGGGIANQQMMDLVASLDRLSGALEKAAPGAGTNTAAPKPASGISTRGSMDNDARVPGRNRVLGLPPAGS